MLRIVSHIENLLLSHDCVIVPGIGGFVTHFEEASFSDDGSEIYPPYCSVSFNSHLSDKEDKYGMLAQSYMTAYDINYPKALSLVSDDVAAMREQLRKNMEFQIGTIGTLQLTLNYSLLFTPSEECGIFAKELYGLVQSKIVKLDSPAVQMVESTNIREFKPQNYNLKSQASNLPTAKPIITRDEDNTHYIIRVSKNAVRYTVTTIAAALLYFVFTIAPSVSPIAKSNVQQAGIIKIENNEQSRRSTPASLKRRGQDSPLREVGGDPSTRQQLQAKYTLVLASAVSVKGATNLVSDMANDGYPEAKVMDDNGMTRVIYSTYPTKEAAYQAAKQLRQQHKRFQSAWVMELEL